MAAALGGIADRCTGQFGTIQATSEPLETACRGRALAAILPGMADDTRARRTWMGIAGIVALGVVVGITNNLVASGTRRLDWVGSYPPKGEPACKKVLPDGATGASATGIVTT